MSCCTDACESLSPVGSSRWFRPLLEAAAVVVVAAVGWMISQPSMSRLLPRAIATGDQGTTLVLDDAAVDIAPRSRLVVRSRDPRATSVFVDRGQATFDVKPQPALRAFFQVHSSDLLVQATDARFTVTCARDGSSITVERGVVDVEANGEAFSLNAGARWPN